MDKDGGNGGKNFVATYAYLYTSSNKKEVFMQSTDLSWKPSVNFA